MKKSLLSVIGMASVFAFGQPANDQCSNAMRICPGSVYSGTTYDATNAGTDYNFCTSPKNTVWFVFTTDADGGDVTVSFTNLSFNADASYGQSMAAMYFTADPCTTPTVPGSTCGSGGAPFTINNLAALQPNTDYYIQVHGLIAGATLPGEATFDIEISGTGVEYSVPTASINATLTDLCQGEESDVTFSVANCSNLISYDWYYNNNLVQSNTTGDYSTTQLPTDGYLKLIVNCGDVCVYRDTTDSILFSVTPISANAGSDKFIASGDQVVLNGNGNGTPAWSPSSSLSSADIFEPVASPEQTTVYSLIVTNNGCVASDSVIVHVGQVITIYSSFTPNGDDINDKWIIGNSAQYPDMEVTIYDRAGQVVFHTTNYSTQDKWWDGTLKESGKDLPASTYFYVIDLKIGEDGIFKGSVTLIR